MTTVVFLTNFRRYLVNKKRLFFDMLLTQILLIIHTIIKYNVCVCRFSAWTTTEQP